MAPPTDENRSAPPATENAGSGKAAGGPSPESSLATRASCLSFVFLVLAALTTWIYLYFFNEDSISFYTAQGWIRLLLVLVLILVIPITVFRTITLWMMRESSRYPDIKYSWKAGLSALHEHGIALRSTPLFLIFAGGDERLRRNFMHASGLEFRVNSVPEGPAPMHWYANPDAIFLVLNDVCWLHAAGRAVGSPTTSAPTDDPRPGLAPADLRGTIVPGRPLTAAPKKTDAAEADDETQPGSRDAREETHGQAELDAALLRGTMVPPATRMGNVPKPLATQRRRPQRVTSETSTQLLRRLQHVCGLLRQARHPVCPINGVLMLLPFDAIQSQDYDIEELERAVSADLSVTQIELQFRCPVTAVVTGMERERGFRELIRRVGQQRAARQRFGQRFDVRAIPTVQELGKFTSHVCGTFEDWVYTQFGEKDALTRPGNALLFALLCRIRRSVGTRLNSVLGAGFGYDESGQRGLPIVFSGCYFAATGPRGDRQAFVRGLFEKLRDEQEEIEWTDEALTDDQRNRWLMRAGWALSLALLVAIVGLFIYTKLPSS